MTQKMDKSDIKLQIPGSLLLLGSVQACEEYVQQIISIIKPDWADVKIVKPEDSKGKSLVTSIDQVREAQSFVSLTPIGKVKLLIFADAASLPIPAANALLKTLEEPPKYALIILKSQSDNLLPTIISRCQRKNLWQNGSKEEQSEWDFDKILEEPFYEQSKLIATLAEDQRSLEFLSAFEDWARNKLRLERTSDKSGLIREIINAKRDVRGNLMPRIVLETLILRYIHHV